MTSHFHSEQEDKECYQDPADGIILPAVIKLELNVRKINKAFDKYRKQSSYKWTLSGSSVFRQSYEHNCAGLSLYLLERGGLRKIVPRELFTSSQVQIMALIGGIFTAVIFVPLSGIKGGLNNIDAVVEDYGILTKTMIEARKRLETMATLTQTLEHDLPPHECTPLQERIHLSHQITNSIPKHQQTLRTFLQDRDSYLIPFRSAAILSLPFLTLTGSFTLLNYRAISKTVTPKEVQALASRAKDIQTAGAHKKRTTETLKMINLATKWSALLLYGSFWVYPMYKTMQTLHQWSRDS